MRSIAELKDQLAEAQAALAEEEQELRRAEMLAEKEARASVPRCRCRLPRCGEGCAPSLSFEVARACPGDFRFCHIVYPFTLRGT